MNRRRQLATLILAAIAVRTLLFDWVGIWGDMGFYTYDARLILEGKRPYIDFIGRSPLFNYLFAPVYAVAENKVRALRWFIVAWWIACIPPVYGIARRIHSHRAGIIAGAVLALTPFSLVYGMWANTQGLAAFLAICSLYALVRRETVSMYAVAGGLMGLAYLSRRSVIAIAAGVGLWTVYQRRDVAEVAARSAAAGVGFAIAIFSGYLLLSYGDPGTAVKLFETHAVGLISSSGRGGFPLLTEATPPPVTNSLASGRVPIFNDVCQLCGAWTARTFAKTLLVTLPIAGWVFWYLRDWVSHYFSDFLRDVLAGALLTLAGYAVVVSLAAGFPIRVGAVLTLVGFSYLAWRIGGLDRAILYDRHVTLFLFTAGALSAAYLYRNRALHTYYFMDFVPLLSVVAGVVYAMAADGWRQWRPRLQTVAVAVVICSLLVSSMGAYPLTNVALDGNDGGWFTMQNLEEYQDDLEGRVGDGDVVFTGHPSYVAGSDARLLFDMPRMHYFAATFKDTHLGARLQERLRRALDSGEVKYAIAGPMTEKIISYDEKTESTFYENYQRVFHPGGLYNKTDAGLYKHKSYIGQCKNCSGPIQSLSGPSGDFDFGDIEGMPELLSENSSDHRAKVIAANDSVLASGNANKWASAGAGSVYPDGSDAQENLTWYISARQRAPMGTKSPDRGHALQMYRNTVDLLNPDDWDLLWSVNMRDETHSVEKSVLRKYNGKFYFYFSYDSRSTPEYHGWDTAYVTATSVHGLKAKLQMPSSWVNMSADLQILETSNNNTVYEKDPFVGKWGEQYYLVLGEVSKGNNIERHHLYLADGPSFTNASYLGNVIKELSNGVAMDRTATTNVGTVIYDEKASQFVYWFKQTNTTTKSYDWGFFKSPNLENWHFSGRQTVQNITGEGYAAPRYFDYARVSNELWRNVIVMEWDKDSDNSASVYLWEMDNR